VARSSLAATGRRPYQASTSVRSQASSPAILSMVPRTAAWRSRRTDSRRLASERAASACRAKADRIHYGLMPSKRPAQKRSGLLVALPSGVKPPHSYDPAEWETWSPERRGLSWLSLAAALDATMRRAPPSQKETRATLKIAFTAAVRAATMEFRQGGVFASKEWCGSTHSGCGCACVLKAGHSSAHKSHFHEW
jgi:hypothetical protein